MHTHIHTQNLMRPEALVVPAKADIVIRLLESNTIWGGYDASTVATLNGTRLFPSESESESESEIRGAKSGQSMSESELHRGLNLGDGCAEYCCRTHPSESLFVDKVVEKEEDARWQSLPKVRASQETTIFVCKCVYVCMYV
jgi:hypothetical protein